MIGVASTTNDDQRSLFSNYGQDLVWVGAPGEGIVTTYPFGDLCSGLGDVFQCSLRFRRAALMLDYGGSLLMDILIFQNQSDSARAVPTPSDQSGFGPWPLRHLPGA